MGKRWKIPQNPVKVIATLCLVTSRRQTCVCVRHTICVHAPQCACTTRSCKLLAVPRCDSRCHVPSGKLAHAVRAPSSATHSTYSPRVYLDAHHLSCICKSSKIFLQSPLLHICTHIHFFISFPLFYIFTLLEIQRKKIVKVRERKMQGRRKKKKL